MKRIIGICLSLLLVQAIWAKPIDPRRVDPAQMPRLAQVSAGQHRMPADLGGSSSALLSERGLVILAAYSDMPMTQMSHAVVDSMMNGLNFREQGAAGSAREYYREQSDGQYVPYFDVVGPVTLPQTHDYYGSKDGNNNDRYLGDLIIDACLAANPYVDFSQYDSDGDGVVDFVYIFYSGTGEADSGNETDIWPNSGDLMSLLYYGYTGQQTYTYNNPLVLDGKLINKYACSNEICYSTQREDGLGTFLHEYTHVIGLPDLYDTSYGQNYYQGLTPGSWHLMDAGSYNHSGITPPNFAAWDKYFCGWTQPTKLKSPVDVSLAPGESVIIYSGLGTPKPTTAAMVYYLENRRRTGWDAYLPGQGLVIWAVNFSDYAWWYNTVNNTDIRYGVLNRRSYPGSGANLCTALEVRSGCQVSHIREAEDGSIVFCYNGGDGSLIDWCEAYSHSLREAAHSGKNMLGDINWDIAMLGSSTYGYNALAGAKFGTTDSPATSLTLTTSELSSCQPTHVYVRARGEGAILSVSIGGHVLGQRVLTRSSIEYEFLNPEGYGGNIEVRYQQTGSEELYLRQLRVTYDDITGFAQPEQSQDASRILHNGQIYLHTRGAWYDIMGRRVE